MADDQTYWTDAQIALVEQARDAAQLAAQRVQTAETRLGNVEERVQLVDEQIAQRQQEIEDVIGANVPDHEWDGTRVRIKNPDGGWGSWVDLKGAAGDNGWAPVPAAEVDGERRVLRVVDWLGGTGEKPAVGLYVGAVGLVAAIADAVDVRGAAGLSLEISGGSVTTLAPGEPATATINETSPGVYELELGIPAGADGGSFDIQSVEASTLAPGSPATASLTELSPGVHKLNLGIPSGANGVSVTGATINGSGELVLTLSDASTINAGAASQSSDMSPDIIRLAMQVADLKNTTAGLANGVSDVFDDATGVDAVASTNEIAGTGYYTNQTDATEASQSLPAMTAASAPAGHVALASAELGGGETWRAFNKTSGDRWVANFVNPSWVQRKTPTAVRCREYAIQAAASEQNRAPNTFTLQGSNNGSSWTTLDTRSGITWSSGERKVFTIPAGNRAAFTYHRLNVTAINGDTLIGVAELELLQYAAPPVMDLRSVAFTALSAPSKASVTVAAKAIAGTITPNTHLTAYASRDGGTTWTAGTLVAKETLGDGTTIFETGEFDISAQPTSTAMKWRVVTGTAFEVQVHAASLLWR
ncbi:hypothetical protein [Arvimicrobium flavum]|uniref:hypothetical protein n=1 Tax=Arvimicrobium flavum TaxID=3393320 RepID=UPI00237B7F25|nr:hypothetical protein [Mesorhizobium shangrilense]